MTALRKAAGGQLLAGVAAQDVAHFVAEEKRHLFAVAPAEIDQRRGDEDEAARQREGVGSSGGDGREAELAARILHRGGETRADRGGQVLVRRRHAPGKLRGKFARALAAVFTLGEQRIVLAAGGPTPHPLRLPEGLAGCDAEKCAEAGQVLGPQEEKRSEDEEKL